MDDSAPRSPGIAFVLEEHLGHRTYAENLRDAADDHATGPVWWGAVTYEHPMRPWHRLPMVGGAAASLAGRREVRAALRPEADVHVFNTQVPAAIGGRRARARPYVVVTDITPRQYDEMAAIYGHQVDRFPPLRWWKHRVNEAVFRDAAACVGWSSWTASSIVDDYGVDPARVEVIPPGVDLARFRPGPSDPRAHVRILFVGGDFERKGGPDLLAALESLPDDVELVAVTKSPIAPGPRVRVIDDLGPNDPRLIELFRSSDVFALPTLGEAFGIAAAEASAAGLPVVASAVGGLTDIVADLETGHLIPAGDREALTRALADLVADPDRRRRMGDAARRRAEAHFDAATNARRLFALASAAAGR